MTTNQDETEVDRALAALLAAPIDPAFAARVQHRARAAYRAPSGLRRDEAAVPGLLLVAGIVYVAASVGAMLRIFVG